MIIHDINCQLQWPYGRERLQEKIHPKVLIDDLLRQMQQQEKHDEWVQPDLFADFNGIPQAQDRTDFLPTRPELVPTA